MRLIDDVRRLARWASPQLRGFASDRVGSTAIEYALIVAILCLGLIAALTSTSETLTGNWTSIVEQIGDAFASANGGGEEEGEE